MGSNFTLPGAGEFSIYRSCANVGLCQCVAPWKGGGDKPGKDSLGMIDYDGKRKKIFKVKDTGILQEKREDDVGIPAACRWFCYTRHLPGKG